MGGATENAVRIQIYSAISTYGLVALIQKELKKTQHYGKWKVKALLLSKTPSSTTY